MPYMYLHLHSSGASVRSNLPNKYVGEEVQDVDLVSLEEGADQSPLGDLHLRQLQVSRTKTRFVEDRKVHGVISTVKLREGSPIHRQCTCNTPTHHSSAIILHNVHTGMGSFGWPPSISQNSSTSRPCKQHVHSDIHVQWNLR